MQNKKMIISDIFSFSFRTALSHITLFLTVAVYYFFGCLALAVAASLLLMLVVTIPFIVIAIPFAYVALDFGCRKVALEVYDYGKSEAGKVFSCFNNTALYGGVAWVLYYLLSSLGFILLVIPGVIVQVRCSLFPYFIIDKKVGPIQAMQMSWDATRGHFWSLVIIWIAVKILVVLGYLTIVGWLIFWPLSTLVYAAVYRKLVSTQDTQTA